MPTNLNALIRYKQIDSCLKNNRYGCSIFDLIEACSDALEEFRGSKKRISERTIRDDIRVLRSEILGFNAPILFEDGKYTYSEKDFNIFKVPILEVEILKEVYDLLREKKEELEEKAVESILSRIKQVLGETTDDVLHIHDNMSIASITDNFRLTDDDVYYSVSSINDDSINDNKQRNKPNILWEEIFGLLM